MLCENSQWYYKLSHCTHVLVQVSTSLHCSSFSRASCQEHTAVPYPSGVLPEGILKRLERRDSCNLFRACFVSRLWIRPRAKSVSAIFLSSNPPPCLSLTWRRGAGIFSINNALDLKLPKRHRSWACRTNQTNRFIFSRSGLAISMSNLYRLIFSVFLFHMHFLLFLIFTTFSSCFSKTWITHA